MPHAAGPTRVCFTLQVHPDKLDEYLARHSPVRPEMLAEIAAAGRRHHSRLLAQWGRPIAYSETDTDSAAQASLPATALAPRWDAEMTPFLVGPAGRTPHHATTPPPSFPQ